jgi:uncharacterized protein
MKPRIVGFDIARALAVFGMVIVNFKIVMGAGSDGPAWLASAIDLLDGRAAATFVVLAGAGISLLSQAARESGDAVRLRQVRHTLLKRACFLFAIGLIYMPLWPADILHFYGVYIAVAAFLLVSPTRHLLTAASAITLTFAAMLLVFDYERGWDWATLSYAGLWTPAGMLRNLFFNGFHPVIPWLAFLLIGMTVGRLNVGCSIVRKRLMLWGAGVAFSAEAVSWILIRVLAEGGDPARQTAIAAIFGTGPMPPMPLYVLAGAGVACAVIGAAIELGERHKDAAWLTPIRSTGQLALTLYVAHVVIGMGTLEAFGRLEHQSLRFALVSAVIFYGLGMLFATAWRIRFKRGPIETAMHALTDSRLPRAQG